MSLEDAQREADAGALKLARVLQSGAALDRYAYGDRPLREEIIQTIANDDGEDVAVVTRNLYGALVLNTPRAMFVDIDFATHDRSAPAGGFFRRLFGRASSTEVEERSVQQVQTWVKQQPDLGVRVYRTCAGLRCLVTNQTFDPTAPATIELLHSVGSDPLYVRLCQAQACFRARLTPKPWRCGIAAPPARYPSTSAKRESRFHKWQSGYARTSAKYSVCRLLQHFGAADVHPEIGPIVELHDQFTCSPTDRPLA